MYNFTGWTVLIVLGFFVVFSCKHIYKRASSDKWKIGVITLGAVLLVSLFANINCIASKFVFSRIQTDCVYAPGDIEGMTQYSPEIRIIHVKSLVKKKTYSVLFDSSIFPMDQYKYEADTIGLLKGDVFDDGIVRISVTNRCFEKVIGSTCVKNEELEIGEVYLAFGYPTETDSFVAGYYILLEGFDVETPYPYQDEQITNLIDEVLSYK